LSKKPDPPPTDEKQIQIKLKIAEFCFQMLRGFYCQSKILLRQ